MNRDQIIDEFMEGKSSEDETRAALSNLGMTDEDIDFNLESLRSVGVRAV